MRILCPACNRDNGDKTTCIRCGTDLTPLHAIHESARWHLAEGRRWIAKGQGDKALALAQVSWNLRHNPDAAGLAFLACLLMRRYNEAAKWYRLGALRPDPSR